VEDLAPPPIYLGPPGPKINEETPVPDSLATSLSEWVIALRLILAIGLGAVIGLGREWLDRAADRSAG
jgi:hypothetical protein